MKKLLLSASIAAALLGAGSSQAATVNSDFTVSVTLDARCTANNSATQTVNFGTYTAFQAGAATAPNVNLTFDCTRNLAAPTVGFDGGTAYGVLAGLNYQLTSAAPSKTTTGSAATAVAGGVGSADTWTIAVGGTMAAGQAGECTGNTQTACNAVTTATRTLILTY